LGEPIADAAADGDGKDQGKADGAGLITAGKQLFEKLFGIFLQAPLPTGQACRSCKNSQKGISHRFWEVNLFFRNCD